MTAPQINRCHVMTHAGRRVIVFDLRDQVDTDSSVQLLDEFKRFVATHPPTGSLVALTDVRGSRYTRVLLDALKAFALHNRPYVRSAAVVATSPSHRIAVTTIAMFTRRRIRAFESPEQALEWLATE